MAETVISSIQQRNDRRFYLVEKDFRVLHTGIQIDLWHDEKWIAGRVEHVLPNGYFFDPASNEEMKPLDLCDGMLVRLTLQSAWD